EATVENPEHPKGLISFATQARRSSPSSQYTWISNEQHTEGARRAVSQGRAFDAAPSGGYRGQRAPVFLGNSFDAARGRRAGGRRSSAICGPGAKTSRKPAPGGHRPGRDDRSLAHLCVDRLARAARGRAGPRQDSDGEGPGGRLSLEVLAHSVHARPHA